jgi:hypothetical protein
MQRLQTNNPIRAQDVREDITFTKEAPKDDRPAESGPPPTRTCPDGSVIPATSACPPPPKADPPRQPPRAATLRSGSISDDDYPASALRAERRGTTTARFTIGTDGRVTSCSVTVERQFGARPDDLPADPAALPLPPGRRRGREPDDRNPFAAHRVAPARRVAVGDDASSKDF